MKNQPPLPQHLSRHRYHMLLVRLQIELVKLQRSVIERGQRILVIVEGRDAAGKDGTIKSIVEHLSPRDTCVVALGPPSNREQRSWYFQRHVPHLPAAGEIVLLNRSWYNRAGVERVMGFCNKEETEEFLETVPAFEAMIERSGITLLKYYLDISKLEQKRRLADRFGAGMVAILLTSAQSDAMTAIPAMIAVSFLASAAIAWLIAPRLRQRYWRAKGSDGDLISG